MAKQLVVLLLELDTKALKECGLSDKQFEELPHAIAAQIRKMAPKAVTPKGIYYLSEREKKHLEEVLEKKALDFSEVLITFNEKPATSKKPTLCTVISLDSYRRKQRIGAGRKKSVGDS